MIAINTILFSALFTTSTIILYHLIRSKDGGMRQRMIEYFSTENWLLLALLVYECCFGSKIRIETQYLFLIAFTPKVIAKIRLFIYLNKK